jgi:DNA-binding response OmpR family regulator
MNENQILTAWEEAIAHLQYQPNPPRRILVVDDDPTIRQVSMTVLERSGYEVDAAEDGAAAWVSLNADCYDLLITDNNMPHVTGIELLKKLRAARMELPVIMATGNPPAAEFRHQPWLEPDAILVKPYAVEAFLQAVKTVLRAADPTRPSSPGAASFARARLDSTVTP